MPETLEITSRMDQRLRRVRSLCVSSAGAGVKDLFRLPRYHFGQYRLNPARLDLDLEIEDGPSNFRAGEESEIMVKIFNRCAQRLSSFPPSPVNLSYRWRREDGGNIDPRPLRSPLRKPIGADERMVLPMRVRALDHPGCYLLALTLVQEGCFWFDDLDPAHAVVKEIEVI